MLRRSQASREGRPKVFGIGFHKTATSSLRDALRLLGYRVTGPNWIDDPRCQVRVPRKAERFVRRYDAFQDNPWPLLYQQMDRAFPGSKFVLTLRPVDRWLESAVKHFGSRTTPMRQWIYGPDAGAPRGHEDVYRERFERHYAEVRHYFRDRPDALLELDICGGEGWEPLCAFLGHEIPDVPFPRSNTESARQSVLKPYGRKLRKLGENARRKLGV